MQKYVLVLLGVLAFALTGCDEEQVVGTVTEESKVLVEDAQGDVTSVEVVTVVDDSNNVRIFTNDGHASAYVNDRFIFTVSKRDCLIDDMPRITKASRIDKEVPKMKHNEAKATLMAKHLNGNKIDLAANDKIQRLEEENARMASQLKVIHKVYAATAAEQNPEEVAVKKPIVYGPSADY